MVIYCVEWSCSPEQTKGLGRITKDEFMFVFLVICRNSQDAYRCLDYYFKFVHSSKLKHSLTLDDGVIKMKRIKVDSRNFSAHYLMLDGMREPVYLPDASSNVLRASRIFGESRCRL